MVQWDVPPLFRKLYDEGYRAAIAGKKESDCPPVPEPTRLHAMYPGNAAWRDGYRRGKAASTWRSGK